MKRPRSTRNITLALPGETLRKLRILAIERNRSVSGLLTEVLEEMVAREEGFALMKRRNLARLARATDLGTGGRATWQRADLHKRV